MSRIISDGDTQFLPRSAGSGFSLPRLEHRPIAWPTRILVCADDSSSAGDALAMANSLAARSNAEVELVSIFAPRIPVPNAIGREGAARCEELDRNAAAELVRSVRNQERRRVDRFTKWPVHLEVGHPVRVIVERAKSSGADLIVLGIGNSDPRVRRCRAATPASLCNYLEVPALAAARLGTALPREAIFFVDRENPDLRTVRAGLGCLEDAARVWVLIHGGDTRSDGAAGVRRDKATISRVLEMVRKEASKVSKGIVVRAAYRTGDAVDAVLSLANEVAADLIVAPVNGAAGAVRSFVPNIADRLVLTARCSVLVVPEETVADSIHATR
jgi:nucleotide-binding universal stress UspA family protein